MSAVQARKMAAMASMKQTEQPRLPQEHPCAPQSSPEGSASDSEVEAEIDVPPPVASSSARSKFQQSERSARQVPNGDRSAPLARSRPSRYFAADQTAPTASPGIHSTDRMDESVDAPDTIMLDSPDEGIEQPTATSSKRQRRSKRSVIAMLAQLECDSNFPPSTSAFSDPTCVSTFIPRKGHNVFTFNSEQDSLPIHLFCLQPQEVSLRRLGPYYAASIPMSDHVLGGTDSRHSWRLPAAARDGFSHRGRRCSPTFGCSNTTSFGIEPARNAFPSSVRSILASIATSCRYRQRTRASLPARALSARRTTDMV